MHSNLLTAAVFFVTCNGGPADHFANFSEALKKNHQLCVFASGPAIQKFQEKKIEIYHSFSLENEDETVQEITKKIAEIWHKKCFILTDLGNSFSGKLHKALNEQIPNANHYAYYDNPEDYVSEQYSKSVEEVNKYSCGLLFANANLADPQKTIYFLPGKEMTINHKIGIGFYPMEKINLIKEKRQNKHHLVSLYLKDKNPKTIVTYFGAANDIYMQKALPAFLKILEETIEKNDLSSYLIIYQQHPSAKKENIDGIYINQWLKKNEGKKNCPQILFSPLTSDQALCIADETWYFQTSMSPQFALLGIPSIQIGVSFDDILVKNQLAPSVTSSTHFLKTLKDEDRKKPLNALQIKLIQEKLGLQVDWLQKLEECIESCTI